MRVMGESSGSNGCRPRRDRLRRAHRQARLHTQIEEHNEKETMSGETATGSSLLAARAVRCRCFRLFGRGGVTIRQVSSLIFFCFLDPSPGFSKVSTSQQRAISAAAEGTSVTDCEHGGGSGDDLVCDSRGIRSSDRTQDSSGAVLGARRFERADAKGKRGQRARAVVRGRAAR